MTFYTISLKEYSKDKALKVKAEEIYVKFLKKTMTAYITGSRLAYVPINPDGSFVLLDTTEYTSMSIGDT